MSSNSDAMAHRRSHSNGDRTTKPPSRPLPPPPPSSALSFTPPPRKRFSFDSLRIPWVTLTPSSPHSPTFCIYVPPKRRPVHPLVKAYLLAFNAVSAAAWGYLLYLTLWFIFTPRTALESATNPRVTVLGQGARGTPPAAWIARLGDHLSGAYDFHGLGHATKYVQTLAVMEVVHAAVGFVRSPVGTVASQVASRLWAVWGVVEMVPATHKNPLFATMLLAWSLTEVVRYPFYFLSLLNIDLYALNWLRYTLFLVLYPLGAGSEAFLSFSTLPPLNTLPYIPRVLESAHDLFLRLPGSFIQSHLGRSIVWQMARTKAALRTGGRWTTIEVARLVLFFVWWPALYVLYSYMLKQRRKFFAKTGPKAKTL